MKYLYIILMLSGIFLGWRPLPLNAQNAPIIQVSVQPIVEKLSTPIELVAPPDGTDRIFIIEQTGKIWARASGKIITTPFLDIRAQIDMPASGYSEKGLL